MKKNILITGGAGFIGYSLALKLLENENVANIVIYDDLSRNNHNIFASGFFKNPRTKFILGNILDQSKFKEALEGIDVVYHLAAIVSEPNRDADSQYFEQINHWGTSIVANEIKNSAVETVIYASSIYVYGHSDGPQSLDSHIQPNSFYGISKLKGEKQLKAILAGSKNLKIFRIGNVFGINATTRYDLLINKLCFDAKYLNHINIYGSGNQIRPVISLENCAKILEQAFQKKSEEDNLENLFQRNLSIMDIVDGLKTIYPNLQYNFVNRNMKMKSIILNKKIETEKNAIKYLLQKIIEII